MNHSPPKPRRETDLILSYPDGYLEVYSERPVDVHLARVPVAFDQDGECMSEEVAAMLLPVRYRDLWRADRLRLVGSTRPLLPSVLCDARFNQAMLDTCNRFGHMAAPVEGAAAAAASKLARERSAG